jgi:hypothetical protein
MKVITLFAVALLALTPDAVVARGGGGGGHSGGHSARSESGRSHGEHRSSSTSDSVNPNYHWVEGYTRRNGTYVQGHYQTNPNDTRNDNYSTRGNINPWTGEPGTKPRDEDLVAAPARHTIPPPERNHHCGIVSLTDPSAVSC